MHQFIFTAFVNYDNVIGLSPVPTRIFKEGGTVTSVHYRLKGNQLKLQITRLSLPVKLPLSELASEAADISKLRLGHYGSPAARNLVTTEIPR